ncbi:L-lactate MFS transporter [Rhodovibrio salinarum]|uniref:MFS transporter n=1 Tax=Rhodovibrio salinarum TaxID=1087 RepID=A0A934V0H0_9PROT|nr:OFA family MFS transporter [Rhodovibrio salinarum]MBK1698202.1 MFS transporter [Rhodovibrio salinarum]
MAGFLDKARIVAPRTFNRWLIPPAALAIHLSIGQVYAFSVFNEPMTRIIGIDQSAPGDWELTTLGWIFSIAIAVLGLTAAFGGRWLERVGPRKGMVVAATAWGGGFLVAALGCWLHSIWLVYLGYGVFGGIGLGFAYISPVKTLIRWFPDRPGMATGMAIMGFGGGAMIGSPLAVELMDVYAGPDSVGVGATFATMGVIYFVMMMFGALIVRVPHDDWQPAGFKPEQASGNRLQTQGHVHVDQALRTPQFWLIWAVLCLNVTAGIGVLGQASVMSQEMVGVSANAAAGFVGLLSIFNMLGRFIWSSTSDYIGRKATYSTFFILGILLYAAVPSIASGGVITLFVLCYLIIISMYGGGFATVPAYLRDLFGTAHVGAIHGRLLTAWSVAGVLGPVLINYLREFQLNQGVPPAEAYSLTMYIMAGLLAVGLLCNLAIRPMADRHLMSERELAAAAE